MRRGAGIAGSRTTLRIAAVRLRRASFAAAAFAIGHECVSRGLISMNALNASALERDFDGNKKRRPGFPGLRGVSRECG